MLRNHERKRSSQRTDGDVGFDVYYQRYGLGDNRLVHAKGPNPLHHFHDKYFHRIYRDLVLLERTELGEDSRLTRIFDFALQVA